MQIDKAIIKEYMSKKQIATQTELAQLLGITKNQLSVMLSPKFNPIKSNVIKLCNLLGASPMEILEKEANDQSHKPENMVAENNRSYTVATGINTLELFAGGGGLALGLEQAGLESTALIEINKYACETLKYNRPHWNVINEDVRNINFSEFKVDVVVGGFPCQAFSYAGKKLGFEDTRGTLFFEFARAVKEIRPKLFLAENVRGIISHDNGRTLKTIIQILTELGYNVEYRLVNAVNYGVPQKRERVIIIGTQNGLKFRFPKEEKEMVTLKDALKDVPLSEGMKYSVNRKRILELVPPGGCWRDLPLEIQKEFMGKSFYSGGGRTGMARRLSWDEPSLTLTTSPSQKQTERCHPEETRPFTVREYARIQTFPDSWEFQGSMSEKYKQIGNAVPVKLAYKIGQSIVECLANKTKNESIDDFLIEDEDHQLALTM
ncbi:DNA (cytosine-5-)-methyltransferase [Bacillota bacterium Lsc_1132]